MSDHEVGDKNPHPADTLPRYWTALASRIPPFLCRFLVMGPYAEAMAEHLEKCGVPEVYAYNFDTPGETPFPKEHFDAVLWISDNTDPTLWEDSIKKSLHFLKENGFILLMLPDCVYRDIEKVLGSLNLFLYGCLSTMGETNTAGLHLMFIGVRQTYNPMFHAQALFDAGFPDWAYQALVLIPRPYLEDPKIQALVYSEMLLCLLAMDSRSSAHRLDRFVLAQKFFYGATAAEPLAHIVYAYQAEFWRRMGNEDMARRLLRSVLAVEPNEELRKQLEGYTTEPILRPVPPTPEWRQPASPPRILFITHLRPHYGLDVLYDGLCRILGDEQVCDFPYKPSLHGISSNNPAARYPCASNHSGAPISLEEIVAKLEAGWFDYVLFGDLEKSMDQTTAQRIVAAARVPIFLLDQQDECDDPQRMMAEWLKVDGFAGLFKREMLAVVDYGPTARPMPFAYQDDRLPDSIEGPRPKAFFWAGHRELGLRRLYLEKLEKIYNCRLDLSFSPEDYAIVMRRSRIGIDIFGDGFDTVRYWETPAFGTMLLAERRPIVLPNNFVDGVSAVFFEDLTSLEEKLAWYIAHPEETTRIAHAGHTHLRCYHLGSQRARELLAHMQALTETKTE